MNPLQINTLTQISGLDTQTLTQTRLATYRFVSLSTSCCPRARAVSSAADLSLVHCFTLFAHWNNVRKWQQGRHMQNYRDNTKCKLHQRKKKLLKQIKQQINIFCKGNVGMVFLCRYRKRTDIYYSTWSFENVEKFASFNF